MVLFVIFRSLSSFGVHVFIVFMLSSFPFVLIVISFIFPCHIVYLHLQWICSVMGMGLRLLVFV